MTSRDKGDRGKSRVKTRDSRLRKEKGEVNGQEIEKSDW